MYDECIAGIGSTTSQLICIQDGDIKLVLQLPFGAGTKDGKGFWQAVQDAGAFAKIYRLNSSIGYTIHNLAPIHPLISELRDKMIVTETPYLPLHHATDLERKILFQEVSILLYAPEEHSRIFLELRGTPETPWKSGSQDWAAVVSRETGKPVWDVGGMTARRHANGKVKKYKDICSNKLQARELPKALQPHVEKGDLVFQTGSFRERYAETEIQGFMRQYDITNYRFLDKEMEGPLEALDYAKANNLTYSTVPKSVKDFLVSLSTKNE